MTDQTDLAHDLDVLRVRNESIRMALAMHARRMADYRARLAEWKAGR